MSEVKIISVKLSNIAEKISYPTGEKTWSLFYKGKFFEGFSSEEEALAKERKLKELDEKVECNWGT